MTKPKRKKKIRKGPKRPLAVPDTKAALPPASPAAALLAPYSAKMARHIAPDEKAAKPVADLMPEIEESLARLNGQCREFQSFVELHIKGETLTHGRPPAAPCPLGGPDHPVDLEASCAKSWHLRPEIILVYAPCAKCKAGDIGAKEAWLLRAGVPRTLILAKASFESWKPRLASDHQVLRACRDWAAHPAGMLVLQGEVGLGKTHLGAAIMRVAGRGRMLTQNSFLMMLRETYRSDRAPHPVGICREAKLLVLDELGASNAGKDEFPALYEVINFRYGDGAPTVVITNVPAPEWTAVFGDRIADRLATAVICGLKGKSWRKPL